MRFARFDVGDGPRVGVVDGSVVVEVHQPLSALIGGAERTPTGITVPLEVTTLLPPLSEDCRGIFCIGLNYVEHQVEASERFGPTAPEHPIFFFKHASAVAGPADDLPLDAAISREFDWEVELGVVIGKAGRNIEPSDVARHIFGYTIVNDITARDLQRRHQQWHLGKNVDRSTPVGPWIVTADEFEFPPVVDLSLRVNGVEKQHAVSSDMIFDLVDQITCLSHSMMLMPGDIIATGTPSGVGFVRQPPEFLVDGDVVESEIHGIGCLRNHVRTDPGERPSDLFNAGTEKASSS